MTLAANDDVGFDEADGTGSGGHSRGSFEHLTV